MLNRTTKTKWLVAIVTMVAMLGVLACGGADEEAAPAAAPATAPAPAIDTGAIQAAAKEPVAASTPEATSAMAAVPSLGEIVGGLAPIQDPERTKPQYLAKVSRNGLVTGVYDGTVPTKFNEAPMLAELVRTGAPDRYGNPLPPVEQRLPDEPAVIPVHEAIGKYGGTWRRFYISPADHGSPRTTILGDWDWNGLDKVALGLKSFSLTNGGRTVTYNMRPGMKWSDGVEFTSKDFKWFYENMSKNEEYFPNLSSKFKDPVSGNPLVMDTPDDYTVVMTYENPNYGWVDRGNINTWDTQSTNCNAPYSAAHYLMQFHPDFADKAALDKMIKDVNGKSWTDVMRQKCNGYSNTEIPTLNAWIVTDGSEPPQWILERNPYYWAVDPAGNQLPYIDYVLKTMIEDVQVGNLKAISGEIDMQGRHMKTPNLPLFQQYTDRGGYRLQIYPSPSPSDWGFWVNQSYDEDPVIGDLLRKRDFRRALGLAVDREEIREVVYVGAGEIRNYAPAKGSLFDPGDEWRNWDIKQDVALANKLLDGIGLTDKDADGFRLRSDGKGPITLFFETRMDWSPPVELMTQQYKEIGLKLTLVIDPRPHILHRANKGYLQKIPGGPGWNCWIADHSCAPAVTASHVAVEVGRWYSTDQAKGEAPTIDKYKNEDGRFIMKELYDAYTEGKGVPMTSPERLKLATFLYSTYNLESLALNIIGGTGEFKGLFVINQDMRNVPDPRTVIHAGFYNQPPRMDIYYYENPEEHLYYRGQ